MSKTTSTDIHSMSLLHTALSLALLTCAISCCQFDVQEATIDDIQAAYRAGTLTSRQLVECYIQRFEALNPILHGITELNPDALNQADQADRERGVGVVNFKVSSLHGIPVLLKDNIATKDLLNTTAGSLALLGSMAGEDEGVVTRLRRAGAVIFGKASMSEWAHFRSSDAPSGWSARSGQGRNPYVLSADPCGSSSGSAIAVAANMVSVSLGTETDGSIICPSAANSAVGIKPTVGLTSRAGVIPISPRQDTIGPICRTVSDAVHVLEAIVGFDKRDAEATGAASRFVPGGGYLQFLKLNGLKAKRIGILREDFFDQFPNGSFKGKILEKHFRTMRLNGAILVDNLQIKNINSILDESQSGELIALLAEFKMSVNAYLSDLIYSPARSLTDVITFNNNHALEEKMAEYGQQLFLDAQNTSGLGPNERNAIAKMNRLSKEGLERLMTAEKLDAVATPDASFTSVLAIGGYPGISVPAGYDEEGKPIGICFGGLKGSEPKLIEIAYASEQATKVRKMPAFK